MEVAMIVGLVLFAFSSILFIYKASLLFNKISTQLIVMFILSLLNAILFCIMITAIQHSYTLAMLILILIISADIISALVITHIHKAAD